MLDNSFKGNILFLIDRNYHCHLVGYAAKMVPTSGSIHSAAPHQSPHSGLHNSVEYASLGCSSSFQPHLGSQTSTLRVVLNCRPLDSSDKSGRELTSPSDLQKTVSVPSVSLSQEEALTALNSPAHTIQSQFTNRMNVHSRAGAYLFKNLSNSFSE